MLQNPCKTLGFKKNMVYKIPPGGGGKPYPASGLKETLHMITFIWYTSPQKKNTKFDIKFTRLGFENACSIAKQASRCQQSFSKPLT